jgi:hypothetical protein
MSNLVHMTRSWNNLHRVHSKPKYWKALPGKLKEHKQQFYNKIAKEIIMS